MNAHYMYLLPTNHRDGSDIKAAIGLLRTTYKVLNGRFTNVVVPGFLYEVATPVKSEDADVLGLVEWR